MTSEVKTGSVVKLVNNCTADESNLRYIVTNINEVTERAVITLICDDYISPSELVSLNDIEVI